MFLGSRARPVRKPDNLTAICKPIVYKMWEPQHLSHIGLYGLQSCLHFLSRRVAVTEIHNSAVKLNSVA
jgi:hypothetical protein